MDRARVSRRRMVAGGLGAAAVLVGGSACAAAPTPTVAPKPAGTAKLVKVAGTSKIRPLMIELGKVYVSTGANVKFTFEDSPTVDTAAAIFGTGVGELDFAMMSRGSKKGEEAPHLLFRAFVKDAVAVATTGVDGITNLTKEQLKQIYGGKIGNWSQMGFKDLQMHVFDRDEEDTSRVVFIKKLMGDSPTPGVTRSFTSSTEMEEALAKTPGAIAYTPLGIMTINKRTASKIIAVDGILPTPATVADKSYPYSMEFFLAFRDDARPDTASFMRWLAEVDARKVIEGFGYAYSFKLD